MVGKEQIVHLPELVLLPGSGCGLGSELGVGVEAEREVPELHLRLYSGDALGRELMDGLGEASAERALEVGEDFDGDRCGIDGQER